MNENFSILNLPFIIIMAKPVVSKATMQPIEKPLFQIGIFLVTGDENRENAPGIVSFGIIPVNRDV